LSARSELCYYEHGRIVKYKYNYVIKKVMDGFDTPVKDLYIDHRNGDLSMCFYLLKSFRISASGRYTETANMGDGAFEIWQRDNELHYKIIYSDDMLGLAIARGNRSALLSDFPPLKYRNANTTLVLDKVLIRNGIRKTIHKQTVFFATDNQLYMIWRQRLVKLSKEFVPIISLDSEGGYLWIGLYGKGVKKFRFDEKRGVLIEEEQLLNELSVSAVCMDREGGFWFSTLEEGIKYLPHPNIR
jgi:hypothetical protein